MGSGTPEQARRFAEEERVIGVLVTDPTLEAYRRGDLKRGIGTVANVKSAAHMVRALRAGHVQGRTQGDPWQQGGILVIDALDRTGKVKYHHAASEAGDPTDFGEAVRAVKALARGA